MKSSILNDIINAQKQGLARGITSICSANPFVLNASFIHARENELPLLIESTCNQVNQYGGYTGQTPSDFMAALKKLAIKHHFPLERLVVGGDHLGPNPWQNEPAAQAMEKSKLLVRDYVRAGYTKIHLDTSMKCADDARQRPLPNETIAARSADLAQVAEETYRARGESGNAPLYVIGTEVPTPGGAQEDEVLQVTNAADVAETITLTQQAFYAHGLKSAWERVIAVVVQPGVEFGDETLFAYQQQEAQGLKQFIAGIDKLVYEAHSTDYQTPNALTALVNDHFAILKVGPALTFAMREAIFALAMIEEELLTGQADKQLSCIREVLEAAMLANPTHWQQHYHGSSRRQTIARQFSFSDRIRYYWTVPTVRVALGKLLTNLAANPIPLPLLSQYLPNQYQAVRSGQLANDPQMLIMGRVTAVLDDYALACEFGL